MFINGVYIFLRKNVNTIIYSFGSLTVGKSGMEAMTFNYCLKILPTRKVFNIYSSNTTAMPISSLDFVLQIALKIYTCILFATFAF